MAYPGPLANAVWAAAVTVWAAVAFGWRHLPKQPPPANRPTPIRSPDPAPPKVEPVSVLQRAPELLKNVCPPVAKPFPKDIPVLTDLYFRVPNPEYWRDQGEPDDLVTWAHELTHGVSNRLHASTKAHGIYLLDGKGIVFQHPRVTIQQVAHAVPKAERGRIYDLYMVQQARQWNDSPAYLLDEWNSYIHGTIARRQMGIETRKETEDHAREMERYCRVLVDVVRRRDPGYPELGKLVDFVDWQSRRFSNIVQGK